MKNVPEKTGNLPNFFGFAKGGGYPQFGKRPNYFRFFLLKASLNEKCIFFTLYYIKLRNNHITKHLLHFPESIGLLG